MRRVERRAVPKPTRIPSGDRSMYPSDEGQSILRVERRAVPKPTRIPWATKRPRVTPGDRRLYSFDEGLS